MARLFPDDPTELAVSTDARITIDPASSSGSPATVELYERFVPFAGPPPPYDFVDQYSSLKHLHRVVDPGFLYQARLFRADNGSTTGTGAILGKLDMPMVNYESRGQFLTSCAESHRPQLKVAPGGTFVAVTVGSGIVAHVRAQASTTKPAVDGRGLPFFPPEVVVASAVSEEADLVHDLVLVDELLQSDTDGHTPLTPGQKLFYVLLAWDDQGNWDYVWGTQAPAPGPDPNNPNFESVTTKRRRVTASLTNLHCIDDSDDLSDGEAVFSLILSSNTDTQTDTLTWDPMPSGGNRPLPLGTVQVSIDEPPSSGLYRVNVHCDEDDSPASDDLAETGAEIIECPVGRGAEDVPLGVIARLSHPLTAGTELEFTAEVSYSIEYT